MSEDRSPNLTPAERWARTGVEPGPAGDPLPYLGQGPYYPQAGPVVNGHYDRTLRTVTLQIIDPDRGQDYVSIYLRELAEALRIPPAHLREIADWLEL